MSGVLRLIVVTAALSPCVAVSTRFPFISFIAHFISFIVLFIRLPHVVLLNTHLRY
ncbi:hypothetical protein B0H13DRAFT_2098580 [Mycena leptocephala]|nr:hypothetical protein B0H13DRAFT_2098580 [Mycena leptocephala]